MTGPRRRPFQAEPHHRQTERRLVLGGFLLLGLGGPIVWWAYGPVPALIAVGVVAGAGILLLLLLLLLKALDAWARAE